MSICSHDCLHCAYDDCINDSVYSEKSLYKNRSEQARKNDRDRQKKARDKAREQGLCLVCRKKKAMRGVKCYECYIRQKRYDKEKYDGKREIWRQKGLCWYCGSEVIPGKKVCQKHYENLLRNIAHCNTSENTKIAQKEFGRKYWKLREAEKNG